MRKKETLHVTLRCKDCGSEDSTWVLARFRRTWGKEYLRDGFVEQYCGCAEGKSGLSNSKHKIVGLVTVRERPVTQTKIRRLLG